MKRRPRDHPVIVHVHAARRARLQSRVDRARHGLATLAAHCWPGPLTLVVPRRRRRGGRRGDGRARHGRCARARRTRSRSSCSTRSAAVIAAPSANRFGRVSPTTAAHVHADLGDDVAVVLDGGPCTVGVESTIVDATGAVPRVLRHGAVDRATIERVTGLDAGDAPTTAVSPRRERLPSHYAPVPGWCSPPNVDDARSSVTLVHGTPAVCAPCRRGVLALHSDGVAGAAPMRRRGRARRAARRRRVRAGALRPAARRRCTRPRRARGRAAARATVWAPRSRTVCGGPLPLHPMSNPRRGLQARLTGAAPRRRLTRMRRKLAAVGRAAQTHRRVRLGSRWAEHRACAHRSRARP